MARIRQIKPEFFKSEDVAGLEWPARMLFIGLWTIAAADGRLLDRPRRIAAELFPYDRMEDRIDLLLGMLAARELIIRYVAAGKPCIQIVNFAKHQKVHHLEPLSELPPPPATVNAHDVGQSQVLTGQDLSKPDETGKEAAQPVETDTSRSGSLGSGSLENGSLEKGMAPAPTRDPIGRLWTTGQWLRQFGLAWSATFHNGARTYGNSDDGKASGALGDLIAVLPESDVLAAQERAPEMFAEFFSDRSKATVDARHRFSWFVNRWGGLRVPAAQSMAPARASPPRDVRIGSVRAEDIKHTETGEQTL